MIIGVAFAGAAALGAVFRAITGRRFNPGAYLPWATLVLNVTGSFALGCVAGLSAPAVTIVGTAGLGALTTFSGFAGEILLLMEEGRGARALAYVGITLFFGVVAAAAGLALAGQL